MINKKYPLILCQWATTSKVDGGGSNSGGNLLGQTQILSQWQQQGGPVRGDPIHIAVSTVVDEGGRQWQQSAADDCVDGG
jgi:hypothetical protein